MSRRLGKQNQDIKPKILLKPSAPEQGAAMPVSITAQPGYIASQEYTNRSISTATPKQQLMHPEPSGKAMTAPVDLLHSCYHGVNTELVAYLRDNPHFRVITVIGRGQQKSQTLTAFLESATDLFPEDSPGVQLFITKDRQFILNVNTNAFHKLGREADLEVISLYVSMLKISHSIVFSEDELETRNSIRWLRYAELMDFGYGKLGLNPQFLPKLIFIGDSWRKTFSDVAVTLFNGSRLQESVSIVGHPGDLRMNDIIKLACRPPSVPMFLTAPMTEQKWYQIVLALFKLHKSNYFLVKYVKASSG